MNHHFDPNHIRTWEPLFRTNQQEAAVVSAMIAGLIRIGEDGRIIFPSTVTVHTSDIQMSFDGVLVNRQAMFVGLSILEADGLLVYNQRTSRVTLQQPFRDMITNFVRCN